MRGLSWAISSQSTTTFYFRNSKSKVIDVGSFGKLVSSACYDKQLVCVCVSICNRFHARRVNSGKITTF